MRSIVLILLVVALSATGCSLNQPDVIVITATFLPPTPTNAPQVAAPTLEPTLPPLP